MRPTQSRQIVGWSDTSTNSNLNEQHAFLYSGGGLMLDLNSLVCTYSIGTYLTSALGINESGQIIANGANGHAYLLTPAPQALPGPPPSPPDFLSITLTGGVVTFTWSTVPFYMYQVQYCSDLKSAHWNDLGCPMIATGTTLSASDYITAPKRFYRIVTQ